MSEMDVAFLDNLAALVKRRALKPTTMFGKEYYLVTMHPESFHQMKCAQARADWYAYYRAVRLLRRIRRDDLFNFLRFSAAWWKGSYKDEGVNIDPEIRARLRQPRRLP